MKTQPTAPAPVAAVAPNGQLSLDFTTSQLEVLNEVYESDTATPSVQKRFLIGTQPAAAEELVAAGWLVRKGPGNSRSRFVSYEISPTGQPQLEGIVKAIRMVLTPREGKGPAISWVITPAPEPSTQEVALAQAVVEVQQYTEEGPSLGPSYLAQLTQLLPAGWEVVTAGEHSGNLIDLQAIPYPVDFTAAPADATQLAWYKQLPTEVRHLEPADLAEAQLGAQHLLGSFDNPRHSLYELQYSTDESEQRQARYIKLSLNIWLKNWGPAAETWAVPQVGELEGYLEAVLDNAQQVLELTVERASLVGERTSHPDGVIDIASPVGQAWVARNDAGDAVQGAQHDKALAQLLGPAMVRPRLPRGFKKWLAQEELQRRKGQPYSARVRAAMELGHLARYRHQLAPGNQLSRGARRNALQLLELLRTTDAGQSTYHLPPQKPLTN